MNKKILAVVVAVSPIVTSIIMCFSVPFIGKITQSIDDRTFFRSCQTMIVFHIVVIVTLFIAKRRGDKDKVIQATMIGWFIALNVYVFIFPTLFYAY